MQPNVRRTTLIPSALEYPYQKSVKYDNCSDISSAINDEKYSKFTLAFLEDTGYYKMDDIK